ncbi:hypothetical protein ACNHUS_01090 [Actinomycetes bacterium M1A6_2h]
MRKALDGAVLMSLGAAGLFNGTALVSDPSGRTLGLRVDMLPAWHTWDYRWAGLFVLVALGIAPLVCGAAILVDFPNTTRPVVGIGVLTVGWVLWQIIVLEVHAPTVQTVLAAAGVFLIVRPRLGPRRVARRV